MSNVKRRKTKNDKLKALGPFLSRFQRTRSKHAAKKMHHDEAPQRNYIHFAGSWAHMQSLEVAI